MGGTETIVGQLSPVQSFAGNAGRDSPDSFFYSEQCSPGFKNYDLILCFSARSKKTTVYPKRTSSRHMPGIIPNREHQPIKPQLCPGLPIRAILENPAKCPDRIGRTMGSETQKRAHSGVFQTGVFCPFKSGHGQTYYMQKRCPPNCNEVHWKAF